MVPEGAMQSSNIKRQPSVLPGYDANKPKQDQDGMITLRVQKHHSYLGRVRLSNCILDTLIKKETVPHTGKLINSPVLVKSWILKEELQLAPH